MMLQDKHEHIKSECRKLDGQFLDKQTHKPTIDRETHIDKQTNR